MRRRRSHRNGQIVRLLSLVRDLARRDGCDLYELAAHHQVTVRTIRRDLDALAEAGIPLVDEDDGRRKRWRIVHDDPRRPVAALLDTNHFLAVCAALGGVTRRSASVGSALEELAARLARTLSTTDRRQLAALRDSLEPFDRGALAVTSSDVLWPLMTAIAERRCCEIRYAPPSGRRSSYLVLPLKLFARDGVPYALVHHRRRDVVMTLALHRIRRLAVTTQPGQPPAGFDPRAHLSSLFGVHGTGELVRYRLRFAPEVAPFILERQWHPTQTLKRRRDGSVDLTFSCQESFEVSAWVASWRSNVEVVEPSALRQNMRGLSRELASLYG